MTKRDEENCKQSSAEKWKKSSKRKKNARFHKKKLITNKEQYNRIETLIGNQLSEKTPPELKKINEKKETNFNMDMNISDKQSIIKDSKLKSPKCKSDDSGEISLSKKEKLYSMKLKEKRLMRLQQKKDFKKTKKEKESTNSMGITDKQNNMQDSKLISLKYGSNDLAEIAPSKKNKQGNKKFKRKKLVKKENEKAEFDVVKTEKADWGTTKFQKEKDISDNMNITDKQSNIKERKKSNIKYGSNDLAEISPSKKNKQGNKKFKRKKLIKKQNEKAEFDVVRTEKADWGTTKFQKEKDISNNMDITDKQSNIKERKTSNIKYGSNDLAEISPSKKNKQSNKKFKRKKLVKKQNEKAEFDVVRTEKADWETPKFQKEKDISDNMDITDKQSNIKNSKPKAHKRSSGDFAEGSPSKKKKLCNMKFKERKLYWKKKEKPRFDIVKSIKADWNDLRREDCAPEKKTQLLQKMCRVLKGRVKEFAFAHDTVRVLECIVAEGTEEHRTFFFEELKDEIVNLSKSLYGKFFVLKILKYGSKKQKETIMNSFQGIVTKLMKHSNAAEVVETAFNECANALQRFQMVQEFYGANYRHFKESNIHSLSELLEMKPETKNLVLNSMKEELMKCLGKTVVKHSLIHHVLLQFFLNCDASSRCDMIESLREVVPEILHTKDGSRVAMQCVWHGTQKDRKIIIKHMKTFVKKIAMEEHGHMVLLALFDCVDDTTLIEKIIIKELQENLLEISQNVHGKKVLIYLLKPRDPHFFHPDVINILKHGDNNEYSKKEPEKRHFELKQAISNPLFELIVNNIADLYKDNAFCLFVTTILKYLVGEDRRIKAFESIAKLAAEPYTSENKNVHILECGGSYFMLKQLILNDSAGPAKGENLDSVSFSEVLVSTVPNSVIHTWCNCNRGAFLLLNLLETEIPAVSKRVSEELMGFHKHLDKLIFKGAELLVKKLRKLSVDSKCE